MELEAADDFTRASLQTLDADTLIEILLAMPNARSIVAFCSLPEFGRYCSDPFVYRALMREFFNEDVSDSDDMSDVIKRFKDLATRELYVFEFDSTTHELIDVYQTLDNDVRFYFDEDYMESRYFGGSAIGPVPVERPAFMDEANVEFYSVIVTVNRVLGDEGKSKWIFIKSLSGRSGDTSAISHVYNTRDEAISEFAEEVQMLDFEEAFNLFESETYYEEPDKYHDNTLEYHIIEFIPNE